MPLPTRRDVLRRGGAIAGLAALPGLGRAASAVSIDNSLRVGVVGVGRRCSDLLARLGYQLASASFEPNDRFPTVDGVEVTAVCDTFDRQLERAVEAVSTVGNRPATYVDYRELLEHEDLDALIVATPDFTHAPIATAAVEKGLDVYVEKCVANTPEQLRALERAAAEHGRIVQTGYQLRQDELHRVAAEYVARGYIGEVRMIRCTVQRHGDVGRFRHPILDSGELPDPASVHWEEFLAGVAPERPYDPKRYFEWRLFWDYSLGICGDLQSHAVDGAEMVCGLGLPARATASGGVYQWKDGRETPDTFTTQLEYPDPGTSLLFSSVNSSSFSDNGTLFFGTEGSIELSWQLKLYADRYSERYAEQIASGRIQPDSPIVHLRDPAAAKALQAAPSELWLVGRGATRTTRGDGEFDTTRLHLEDFFDAVRTRREPAAGLSVARSSTIAAQMSAAAYREGRTITPADLGFEAPADDEDEDEDS